MKLSQLAFICLLSSEILKTSAFTPNTHGSNGKCLYKLDRNFKNAKSLFSSALPDTETEIDSSKKDPKPEKSTGPSFSDRMANSGVASAAAMATAAVNAAVAMKSLEAPDVAKSYIALDNTSVETDLDGLPYVYDKEAIETYWKKERGALNQRWSYFVGKAVPFLSKMVTLFITEGKIDERHIPGLSKQARIDLQDLGPTFIKAGQVKDT